VKRAVDNDASPEILLLTSVEREIDKLVLSETDVIAVDNDATSDGKLSNVVTSLVVKIAGLYAIL
jgi:putative N-acetylmannosamine-6-phosphate epimerase